MGTPEVGTNVFQRQLEEIRESIGGISGTPGAAGGIATLDDDGVLHGAQLPPTGNCLTVAASNASARVKERADYICDGTADDVDINAALAAASLFGTEVALTEGWFSLDDDIEVTKDNVRFVGVSKGQPLGSTPQKGGTLLIRSANFKGTYGVKFNPAAEDRVLYGVTFENISLDGLDLGDSSVDGVLWRAARSTMRNVWVTRWKGNGISPQSHTFAVYPKASHDNLIENVRVDACGLHGMSLTNGSTDNLIRNCIVTGCGGNGISMSNGATPCTANMIIGNYIYSNTGKAVSGPLYQTQMVGNRIQDCNGGVYLDNTTAGAGGFQIVGNILRNCSIAADNTTDGINIGCTVGSARGGMIASNAFHTDPGDQNSGLNRMRYGINITSSAVRDVSIGAQSSGFREATSCFGTGMLNDTGTGTTYVMGDRVNLRAEGDATVTQNAYGTGAVPTTFLRGSRGTILAPLRVKTSDVLGRWGATGAAAASDEAAASLGANARALIEAISTEDFTSTGQGTSLLFKTTTTGSLTTNERFRLNGGEGIDFNQGSFATYMMRLKNNAVVMGRNNAAAANVSLFKINTSDQLELMADVLHTDAKNIVLGSTTGTKIGTATTQKLAFFNKTPIVQPGAISSPAAEAAALKTAVDAIRTALTNLGLTA